MSAPEFRYGQLTANTIGNVTFPFGTPFPNACDSLVLSGANVSLVSYNASGFTVTVGGSVVFNFIAAGH